MPVRSLIARESARSGSVRRDRARGRRDRAPHRAPARRITVHGDYDVDGVCATAIIVRALRALGADVDWFMPSRLEDGYGLSSDNGPAARRARHRAAADRRLRDHRGRGGGRGVARPGSTSSSVRSPRAAGGRAAARLPDRAPRRLRLSVPRPVRHRGGVQARPGAGSGTADEDLELVALATVADLVPLRGENRRLVREGLAAMANTGNPGLRALMSVAGARPERARRPGTRVPARATDQRGRTPAPGRRRARAAADRGPGAGGGDRATSSTPLNGERRAVEQRIVWEAETQVAAGSRTAALTCWPAEDWHPGVIGIVASRIVERHHRPAILIALDGRWVGAPAPAGAFPDSTCSAALHAAAGYLERYGGHRAAAGLSLARRSHSLHSLRRSTLTPLQRADARAAGAGRARRRDRLGRRAGARRWPRSWRRWSRVGWATRRRGCWSRARGSATCARWGRVATPGSP